MMTLKSVKLGNMRKIKDWTIYPHKQGATKLTIQCDARIAEVDLTTGKAMLSNGKGGHQGFLALSPMCGATEVDVPAEIVQRLKEHTEKVAAGPVSILSLVG